MVIKEGYLLRRSCCEVQTLGSLIIFDGVHEIFQCATLELPWRDNQRNISCIPSGRYIVLPRTSKKYKNHYHVQDTNPRNLILIHHGNYHHDTHGCILVGRTITDINADGVRDITHSKDTMANLLKACGDKTWKLHVINEQ